VKRPAVSRTSSARNARAYLVGEKFLNFLEAAEDDAEFRAEIPAFAAEIKSIFERWQLEVARGGLCASRQISATKSSAVAS
jgi:hypothetical protein